MESTSGPQHIAFFEELAKLEETDSSWKSVSAGLVVLRLVDEWIASGSNAVRCDSWSVNAVREAIASVPETTPLRRILTAVVDGVVSLSTGDAHSLNPRLMAYGQSLEFEDKWALAQDVYETILANADPVEDADLVVSAFIQLAFCRRTRGDIDGAAVAYEQASRVALAAGDLIGVLRGRLGDAKIATARGNMPQAESILDETIARSQAHGLDDVRARALHDRAYVAALRGQHSRAIRFSYEALELTRGNRERDRTLNNIATGFRYLGLFDVARDAYLVLAATAQEQYVRWLAEINLMELAAQQQSELQFDKYRRDLESADFTPQLRITYLMHVGRGYMALDQSDAAIPYLERAVELASGLRLNQMLFEAEEMLSQAKRGDSVEKLELADYEDAGLGDVIDGVQSLKLTAGIA
jgi:tetratricopeptide (TPR) repeat protein